MRKVISIIVSLCLVVVCLPTFIINVSAAVTSEVNTYTFDFSSGGMAETLVNSSNYTDSNGNTFYPLHSTNTNTTAALKQIEVIEKDDSVKTYDSLEYVVAGDTIFIPVDANGKPYEVKPDTTYSVKLKFFAKTVGAYEQFFAGAGAYEPYKQAFSSTTNKFEGRKPTNVIYSTGSYAYGGTWTGSYYSSETGTSKVRMFDDFDKGYGAHYYENTATFTTGNYEELSQGFKLTSDNGNTVATFGNYFCIAGGGSLVKAYDDNGDGTRTLKDSRYTQFNFIEITVTELKPAVIEDINGIGLNDESGFIAGNMIKSIDFTGMEKGTDITSLGWETSDGYIVGSPNGNGNALNLKWNWGETYLRTKMDTPNYVVVAKLGCEETNAVADGWPRISVRDTNKNGDTFTAMQFGYGQNMRASTSSPKPGQIMFNTASHYDGLGYIEFDGDGYTETILTIYCFDDVYYFYINGEYLGKEHNCAVETVEGENYLYICDAWVESSYIHWVATYEIIPAEFSVENARFSLNDTATLDVAFKYDASKIGDFDIENAKFGAVVTWQVGSSPTNTTKETQNSKVITFNTDKYEFIESFEVEKENADKFLNVRPYVLYGGKYFYGKAKAFTPANLAVNLRNNADSSLKSKIDKFFENSKYYKGENSRRITFTAIGDFHYFKSSNGFSNLSDLKAILDRAQNGNASLVLHVGDFCQEVSKSPELYNLYHNYEYENGEVLNTYGIYGNHETEQGGAADIVIPTLTNDSNAVWGTADGKMNESEGIAYYYVDTAEGFRFIFLDSNYSYNPTLNIWEKNKAWDWSWPEGNINGYSLGPAQTKWLEDVLTDAGEKDIPCIISSHTAFNTELSNQASDADEIREMFKKINGLYPQTVMMCLSGHTHSSRVIYDDGIVWVNLNHAMASFNTADSGKKNTTHYTDEHIRTVEEYDENGNFVGYGEMSMKNSQYYYCEEALSSTITIDESGIVIVDGYDSEWAFGVAPDDASVRGMKLAYRDYKTPYNEDYVSFDCVFGGHFDGDKDNLCDVCQEKLTQNVVGDINNDNEVNAADLALLKKQIVGLEEFTANSDVTGDGECNAADLALLKKVIAGLINTDPTPEINYEDKEIWTDPIR